MKDILFRAKSVANEEWMRGYVVPSNEGLFMYQYGCVGGTLVNPATLCQSSGMTDSRDKQIFDGDIIDIEGCEELGRRIVVFYEGAFAIATPKEFDDLQKGSHPYFNDYAHMDCLNEWIFAGPVRVIGNVFDNIDMIK